MNDDDRPVTRRELMDALAELPTRAQMSQVAKAVDYAIETLSARMDRMRIDLRDELSRELAGHVRAAAEENRRFLVALDDRYRDLPGRVSVLERELDEHRRDSALHPRRRR